MNIREIINEEINNMVNNTQTIVAYHGSSKIKSERHGLPTTIEKFSTLGHWAQRVSGAYFTPFFDEAKKYAKHSGDKIYQVELKFNNLADRNILDKIAPIGNNGEQAKALLIKNGYDGVYDEPMKEIIAFYESQIKILNVIEIE